MVSIFSGESIVPAEVLVAGDDVEVLAERIFHHDGVRVGVVGLERGGDEARGIERAGAFHQGGEELQARIAARGFVGDAPEDDRRAVLVARDHLGELLFGVAQRLGVLPGDGPVDGNLRPDEQAHLVGEAGHDFVVRIVRQADEVAVHFLGPLQQGARVGLGVDAAGAEGRFGVDGDAAQVDRLAVEQKVAAAGLDGAEADAVGNAVGAGLDGDVVEFGALRRPEVEAGVEGDAGETVGIGREGLRDAGFGDADGDLLAAVGRR